MGGRKITHHGLQRHVATYCWERPQQVEPINYAPNPSSSAVTGTYEYERYVRHAANNLHRDVTQRPTEQRIPQRFQPVPTLTERARSASAAAALAAELLARSAGAVAELTQEVAIGNNDDHSDVMCNDGGGDFDVDDGPHQPNADETNTAIFSSFVAPVVV